ncbi:MAG: class I SAM-dependent methyltransferase [Nitrosarchaeum sp.]|nr:class I SAM-dependent methyltransferase [Nitrosarchaeum sp.]
MMKDGLWDDMASDYDESVENNKDPIIIEYLTSEMEILSALCEKNCPPNKNCSIIDMGAGTGRVVFALADKIKNNTLQFYGVEISEPMIKHANQKNQVHHNNQNIRFLKHDLTDPNLSDYFDPNSIKIVMCLYNTLGVVPSDKRQMFVDNMIKIAEPDGLVIITAFNGDDFGFVAPRLYHPMMTMIRQIEKNSFDERNRVFQNSLGFHSQWFTRAELKSMLHSDIEPIPIEVVIDDEPHTFGNVFVNKKLM